MNDVNVNCISAADDYYLDIDDNAIFQSSLTAFRLIWPRVHPHIAFLFFFFFIVITKYTLYEHGIIRTADCQCVRFHVNC